MNCSLHISYEGMNGSNFFLVQRFIYFTCSNSISYWRHYGSLKTILFLNFIFRKVWKLEFSILCMYIIDINNWTFVAYILDSNPAVGEVKRAEMCVQYNRDHCVLSFIIPIKNCGTHVVYHLEPTDFLNNCCIYLFGKFMISIWNIFE